MDYVDRLRAEWAERLPDVDTSTVPVMARVTRISALFDELADRAFAAHGTTRAEFDVLAVLRRADRLLRAREITTVTRAPAASVTKRLDRLEGAGLVKRTVPDHDRRGVLVGLTAAGRDLVDTLFPQQVARERSVLADLDDDEVDVLAGLLARVLGRLELPDGG
ncbi:MarR family winged helix-turn-helix transcriptional regulator [Luteimicrobium subarcticum]|uniref:MarR family transcriptional regulator n=1 Tax=Luteimicrobium subarcticum TaxID=620910 RepID=A0A2M8WUT6_9MICO|nr:MarR family transcriptional regulator [Luteimicrobium subarcticum]PJI94674.1 MarR family transcriptional regulator [Luteimicrobium subarcticum]